MGLWARTGRFWRGVMLLAVGLAGGAAGVAVATVPDSNGVIHGCYSVTTGAAKTAVPNTSGPNLTVIDPSAGQTCDTTVSPAGAPPTQRALDWNVSGPPGAQGAPGQQGPQGPPGNTNTVTKGGTLTLSGGQVLQVESAGGGITLPTPNRHLPRGSGVVMKSGTGAVDFPILDVSVLSSQVGGAPTGNSAGRVSIKDVTFTKKVDKSSPVLFKACASGQHFKTVSITLRKASGKAYLRYTLSNVLVSAIQSGGASGQEVPTEQVSLNFTKIEVKYVAQ